MAKKEVIDGTTKGPSELTVYEVPIEDLEIPIEFSDELKKEEHDIASIQVTSDLLGLFQGVKICHLEREELWRQDGFENLRSYRIKQAERLGMPRSTISKHRAWGAAWLDHRKFLRRVKIKGNVSKLYYLEEALLKHSPTDVLEHFKADTLKGFVTWIRPALPEPVLPSVAVKMTGLHVYLDDSLALTFDKNLPAERRALIVEQLRDAAAAWAQNCIAHTTSCYSREEARWLDRALAKHRAEK